MPSFPVYVFFNYFSGCRQVILYSTYLFHILWLSTFLPNTVTARHVFLNVVTSTVVRKRGAIATAVFLSTTLFFYVVAADPAFTAVQTFCMSRLFLMSFPVFIVFTAVPALYLMLHYSPPFCFLS